MGYISKSAHNGLHPQCRKCDSETTTARRERDPEAARERERAYYAQNLEASRAKSRRWREKNPKYMQEYEAARPWAKRLRDGYGRAVEAGLPAEPISEADLLSYWEACGIDPNFSHYSGIPLTDENRGLDHLFALKSERTPGHVISNLVPCTKQENSIKGNKNPFTGWVRILFNSLKEKNDG